MSQPQHGLQPSSLARPTPPKERRLDKFAAALAGTLALGSLFSVLLIHARATERSWGGAIAPFAAGAVYAGGCSALLIAQYRRRRALPGGRLVLLALPVLGALAGWAWVTLAPDATRGPGGRVAHGALLGVAHAAYTLWRARRNRQSGAPAEA